MTDEEGAAIDTLNGAPSTPAGALAGGVAKLATAYGVMLTQGAPKGVTDEIADILNFSIQAIDGGDPLRIMLALGSIRVALAEAFGLSDGG